MAADTKDVFISHAYSDKERYIKPLIEALQRHGVSYWIDSEQIPWGGSLMLEIGEGLRVSQFVLLCLSKNTFERRWAENEMGAAIAIQNRHGQRRVLPLILDDQDAVLQHYPLISDLSYRRFSDGADKIAAEIRELANTSRALTMDLTVGETDIVSAETCVTQLSRWFDQLSSVLACLRSRIDILDFDDFSEVLAQLHLQIAASSPIYLQDALVRGMIERSCPDFDQYARAKGILRLRAASDTTYQETRQRITDFLDLCEEAEKIAIRVKNPNFYDPGHPARKGVLAEAISELNEMRLKLNESVAVLSYK